LVDVFVDDDPQKKKKKEEQMSGDEGIFTPLSVALTTQSRPAVVQCISFKDT
jgi:hypothetical protein